MPSGNTDTTWPPLSEHIRGAAHLIFPALCLREVPQAMSLSVRSVPAVRG